MKILFIIPSITNYFTFLEDLINKLLGMGMDVHLATSTKHIGKIDCYKRDLKCTLHEIHFPRGFNFFMHFLAAKKLNNLVTKIKPDLIEVHFSAAIFTTVLAKNRNWPPISGTIHGLGSSLMSGVKKVAVAMAENWSINRVDHIYVLNQVDLENLKLSNPSATISKINGVGLGCDLQAFNSNDIDEGIKQKLKESLGITFDDFVFIFIGRQINFKGFDKVVTAYLNLCKNYKNTKLILVGSEDNMHHTGLSRAEKKRMQACENIIQVDWCENVNEYLAIANLNVFPSQREGMPVNLMESIAMGIPVITSDTRGCNEVIKNEYTGIILKENTEAQIERSMLELFVDSDRLELFSKNALQTRHRFDRKYYIDEQLAKLQAFQIKN